MNEAQLAQVMPHASLLRLCAYAPHLAAAQQEFQITTREREAAFIAQVAHESGELRWMHEVWGPTPQQRKYERPAGEALSTDPDPRHWPLWQKLGNTERGDGFRFRGRSPLQLTGRANYTRVGSALGLDLISAPDLAESVEVAFRVAGYFWWEHGLNALADCGDFLSITRRINGGVRGLSSREAYYGRARAVLGLPPLEIYA